MLFFESAADERVRRAFAQVQVNRNLFDDEKTCFFGVTCDPSDAAAGRIAKELPGIRFFLDYDHRITTLYGLWKDGDLVPQWLLLDPALRVVDTFPIDEDDQVFALLQSELRSPCPDQGAPVLMVRNVFPQDFCQKLLSGYEQDGGHRSGFMREVGGKTIFVVDDSHKQRRDWDISEQELQSEINGYIARHLAVPIQRSFQFRPTRIERYLVACYEAGSGFFRAHRDNTTSGTAHRKFAVTINLNACDYDGGDLRFPEFGERTYRAPTGGAIVFSCSLLHEAMPVTRGKRFAFLPFLYDEEAARLREKNNPQLAENVPGYRKR